jgi:hypothetical protein
LTPGASAPSTPALPALENRMKIRNGFPIPDGQPSIAEAC